jgi:hypothetical protein
MADDHKWHVAINRYADGKHGSDEYPRFMYEAKRAYRELGRMTILFKQEREGTLPKYHQQWIHSAPESLNDNYLSCCLGVRCSECPHLLALNGLDPEMIDAAKAFTCMAHIIESGGDPALEGYLLTQSDKKFWENLYSSLAEAMPPDRPDDKDPDLDYENW